VVALIPLIAQRLKHLRARHSLTQEEVAQISGFSFKFYQQLESGKKKQMWLETVERLAAAYGIQAWELIGPELPEKTELAAKPLISSVHYKKRKGPYKK
jgi:transcriptional regulator with XRE-family HTH domain